MEASLYVPLKEQEQLKNLLRLMDEHGFKEEMKQVLQLTDYIDGMERQFGAVLEELGTVKEQLGQMQDKGIKKTALRAVAKIEGKVQEARQQLYAVKARFMAGVSQAVNGFKDKGIFALYQSLDVLGIQKGLIKLQERLHVAVENTDIHFDRLGNIGDELHEAKTHLGNIGRELRGKEMKVPGSREVEKGTVFQVQKLIFHTAGVLKGMEKRTDAALKKTRQLEEKANAVKKPSVRESLKAIEAREQGKDKAVNVPDKTKESAR